jgi:predicted GIY-YIG superfamily endonuclease
MLRCADGSYYVGITRDSVEKRIAEHQEGTCAGYTSRRRPVELVFRKLSTGLKTRLQRSGR